MNTFRHLVSFSLLLLSLVGCGGEDDPEPSTIAVETAADAGAPDDQPAAPDAGTEPREHCRYVQKLGVICVDRGTP